MKTKQIWKLGWNPNGVREEGKLLDLTKINKLDEISLFHSYFIADYLKCYSIENTEKVYYKVHEILQEDTDILICGKDIDLSTIAMKPVYSRIKLISTRVSLLNSLYVDATYLADILNPDCFQQDLTPESDVTFNSITVQDALLDRGTVKHLTVQTLEGEWGFATDDEFNVQAKKIRFKTHSVEDDGFHIDSNVFNTHMTNHHLQEIDGEQFVVYQYGVPIATIPFMPPYERIPDYGIPVSLTDTKTKLQFVDFLKLDPEKNGIYTENLKIKDTVEISPDTSTFGKAQQPYTIKISDIRGIEYHDGKLYIGNGAIVIDITTKAVTINGITIDNELLITLNTIKNDIAMLKEKVRSK
jgi:hypothetical protein